MVPLLKVFEHCKFMTCHFRWLKKGLNGFDMIGCNLPYFIWTTFWVCQVGNDEA